MSVLPHDEPTCSAGDAKSIELTIDGRERDLGEGFTVRRVLPAALRKMIGPFIFFDQMGPVRLPAERGLDVRPHPHIHLSTVTYLFEGEILHRDSLGSEQLITPGAVNWMTAGTGIVHSERSPLAARKTGPAIHGLQLWLALPKAHEDTAPTFQHVPAADVPVAEQPGAVLRVLAGAAYGERSPANVLSDLFYVDAQLEPGTDLRLPENYAERAAYVAFGRATCDGKEYGPGNLLVFRKNSPACLRALENCRVILLGGAPLDGERHMFWNFVSSSPARIEAAKTAWRERRFPAIPGDDGEFIPLPPGP